MLLRWYQDEAVFSLFDYFDSGNKGNPVIAMPTGTGKSLVIADFLKKVFAMFPSQRVMMLTHVKELIQQNAEELLKLWPTAPLGIYSAGLRQRDVILPIVFGGIASVYKAPEIFGHRDLIIIDECHLLNPTETTMYQTTIKRLKEINPFLKVIGLSATPYRLKQGLLTNNDALFTDVCYDITSFKAFNRLIGEGYISPLITQKTIVSLDVSSVGIGSDGDFRQNQLQKAVDVDEVTYAAVKETVAQGNAQNRSKWLIFATGIEHAEHINAMLQSFGVASTVSHSKLKGPENDKRIRAFKNDEFKALVNMNKFTTGFNHPPIDLIADLQPTMSPGKHVQKYGRGTRPSPSTGKRNCLALDFARNVERLGPINDPNIPTGKKGKKTGEIPIKLCEPCGAYNHISARVCCQCEAPFNFENKLFKSSSEEVILRDDAPIFEILEVQKVLYHLHVKKNSEGFAISPPSIRVSYFCGLLQYKEWVCLEHSGLPGKRARDWWRQRHLEEPPPTTHIALQRISELREPKRIRVWVNTKFPEIVGYEY